MALFIAQIMQMITVDIRLKYYSIYDNSPNVARAKLKIPL